MEEKRIERLYELLERAEEEKDTEWVCQVKCVNFFDFLWRSV